MPESRTIDLTEPTVQDNGVSGLLATASSRIESTKELELTEGNKLSSNTDDTRILQMLLRSIFADLGAL